MVAAAASRPRTAIEAALITGIPLGQLPAHHAAAAPDAPAITLGETVLTRAGLEAAANRRARQLATEGVQEGDFVTVALPNCLEFYETSFAIWKLGATPNVVSHKLPDAELGAIVQLVDPRLVIGVDAARLPGRRVREAGAPVDETLSAEPMPSIVPRYWKAMTSGGSTGRPKIIVDHMPGLWDPTQCVLAQKPGDTLLNPGPLYHNAPFIVTHYALFTGGNVIEMVKFEAERALQLIERHEVSWVNMVPTMMQRIWRLDPEIRGRHAMDSLRVLFHMASACPEWLKQAYIDWLGPERVIELYGGAERQGATVITGTEWVAHRGSVGRPLPGSRVRVLDEDGKDCPPGTIGEIHFLPDAGAGSSYHYIGADPKLRGEWDSLGDMGWLDTDGYLYLADRRVDLIIVGGANIYPAEVEAALDSHPDVLSSAVIGLPDDDLGQRVHAIVQLQPDAAPDASTLSAWAETRLARYKAPRSIEFVDEPLRDDAGKVRRSALREARMPH